jgi:hypothetical protein
MMNNNASPFSEKRGFQKSVKDDPPTRMVYLFCEEDQDMAIIEAKTKCISLPVNLVDTEDGLKAYTRKMLLTEKNFQSGAINGVQNIANLSRGERVVDVALTCEPLKEKSERMQIDVFLKSGYDRESDGAELTA